MLHIETVEPRTLSLLKDLMTLPALKSFSLVGGTVMSLRYGHRSSVDLDLFFHKKVNLPKIIDELEATFHRRFVFKQQQIQFGIFCFIDDIKVDIIHYPPPPIAAIEEMDTIRMYSSADISAMKIQAILGRAQKKDFWDLYELLQYFPLQQLIDWHKQKYPSQMLAISIPHALTYFADAEESEPPVSYKKQTWGSIKTGISRVVSEYLK